MKDICIIIIAVILFSNQPVLAGEQQQIEVKNISSQRVLLLKGKSSMQTIGPDMGSMYGKVYGYMGTKKINPAGAPIALYYSEPGPEWEIGVAVPVPDATVGQGAIESTTLPGDKMVSTQILSFIKSRLLQDIR